MVFHLLPFSGDCRALTAVCGISSSSATLSKASKPTGGSAPWWRSWSWHGCCALSPLCMASLSGSSARSKSAALKHILLDFEALHTSQVSSFRCKWAPPPRPQLFGWANCSLFALKSVRLREDFSACHFVMLRDQHSKKL